MSSLDDSASDIPPDPEPTPKDAKVKPVVEARCSGAQNEHAEPVCSFSHQPDESVYNTDEEEIECAGCIALQTQKRILKNGYRQLGKWTAENWKYRKKGISIHCVVVIKC